MKVSKKLVTVVLPQQVLAEVKSVQKKFGIPTLSSLLRTALAEKAGVSLKAHKEKTRQISFRVESETVDALTKLAKQNGRSLAEVVRVLIANVGRIPAKKLAGTTASPRNKRTPAKPAKSPTPAKPAAKPVAKVVKSAKRSSGKSVPAKKNVSAKPRAKDAKKKRR